jgi:hypothetical protein
LGGLRGCSVAVGGAAGELSLLTLTTERLCLSEQLRSRWLRSRKPVALAGYTAATPPAEEGSTESLWAELPPELQVTVLTKVLQAAKTQQGGWCGCKDSAAVRLVCAQWQAVHDALVMRLVLRPETTDKGMGMLVRRFPAVASLEREPGGRALTDEGVRAASSLPALTKLDLRSCHKITDEALRAVSSCTALTSLNLTECCEVTDEGLRAVCTLPALTFLDLWGCGKITDETLRAVSNLRSLAFLDLIRCPKVTAAGVQALRDTTSAPNLEIECDTEDASEEDPEDWDSDMADGW